MAARRQLSLQRLRRRLTILPVDARVGEEVARRASRLDRAIAPTVLGMLCALEVVGCEELVTDSPIEVSGKWRFRISKLTKVKSKEL